MAVVDVLRSLPIAYFIWFNPVFYLFLVSPLIVFWIRHRRDSPADVGVTLIFSILTSWGLALLLVFGTDQFLWFLANLRDPIPEQWERFLFADGARDVFVVLLGWLYGLGLAIGWSPVIAIGLYLRRHQLRRQS